MKYWSRAFALIYLAFMAGCLFAMIGDDIPTRPAYRWDALTSLKVVILCVLCPFLTGLLAGIEHGKERHE